MNIVEKCRRFISILVVIGIFALMAPSNLYCNNLQLDEELIQSVIGTNKHISINNGEITVNKYVYTTNPIYTALFITGWLASVIYIIFADHNVSNRLLRGIGIIFLPTALGALYGEPLFNVTMTPLVTLNQEGIKYKNITFLWKDLKRINHQVMYNNEGYVLHRILSFIDKNFRTKISVPTNELLLPTGDLLALINQYCPIDYEEKSTQNQQSFSPIQK